jgi:hypothetical protein
MSEEIEPGVVYSDLQYPTRQQMRLEIDRLRAQVGKMVEALVLSERWFDSSRVNHHSDCKMSPCDCGVEGMMQKFRTALSTPAAVAHMKEEK